MESSMTAVRSSVVPLLLVITLAVSATTAQTKADAQKLASPTVLLAGEGVEQSRLRVGPGDLLGVKVFDVGELTQEVRVSDRGEAIFTFLGPLQLAGLTTAEAQTLVENRLRDGNYVREPHVSIMIQEYATQGVSVLGQVGKPGVYPVLGSRTLLDVISEAGGITPLAAHEATIKRRKGGDVISASLSDNPGELLASDVELWPGDTVIVPKAGIVYVIGDVGRPGGFIMENNGRVTLLEAVALAAGVNRTAAQSKTRVIRKTAGGYEDMPVDLKRVLQGKAADIPLEREDIVYVPPSMAKTLLLHSPQVLESAAASAAVYAQVP
jgi:polysaccharide export outer membrane protein